MIPIKNIRIPINNIRMFIDPTVSRAAAILFLITDTVSLKEITLIIGVNVH